MMIPIYKIYIADDEKLIRESISHYVNWPQISAEVVGTGGTGMEALKYLLSHPVDILITDIKMPVMDGIRLVKKIAEMDLPLRVIFISAYSDFEYARHALRYYFVDDYIIKPIQPMNLLTSAGKSIKKLEERKSILRSLKIGNAEMNLTFNTTLLQVRNELLKQLQNGNLSHSIELFRSIIEFWKINNASIAFCKRYALELYYSAKNLFDAMHHNLDTILGSKQPVLDITRATQLYEISNYMENLISIICTYVSCCQENKLSGDICTALELTEANYLDKNFNLLILAEMLELSPNHLSAKFKKETGKSFTTLLQNMRLEKAKDFLKNPAYKIYEIADMCGIGDVRYFAHLFNEYTGYTPKDYRADVLNMQ